MSKIALQLSVNQYLTSFGIKIEPNKSTFLVAPTGAGKTTFTMEELKAQFKLVLILVPTQAKVMELQHEYSEKTKVISEYLFFCANENPDDSLRKFKGVIVATYDKFDKIIQLMSNSQKKSALLVIDEAHKLYSAGSFRDDALTPVIWHLQKRSIPTSLFLTATKTTELFDQLKIDIDQEIYVTHQNPPLRDIRVTSLPKGDQYTAIAIIEQKVKGLLKTSDSSKGKCGKTIIVRINSRDKCENMKRYFEQRHKLKCIVVHSKTKNQSEVKAVFETQKIPTGIDIVFTTSIMDEAVNLNNSEIEIDSVFILDKKAHVEELVQFIGRLRIANVPCHILLHTGLTKSNQDPEKLHLKHHKRLNDFITRVNGIAQALASLAEDYKFDFQDNDKPNIYDKVNRMNESFKDWLGCKLFAVYQGKSIQNTASLVSALYLIDASYFYSSLEYMAWRIKQFLPNCKIQFCEDTTVTPSYITHFFDEQKVNADKAYAESINPALKIFLENFQKGHRKPESLKQLSTQFIEHKQQDEEYIDHLAYYCNDQLAYPDKVVQILNEIVYLAQHIGNIHDIYQILTQKRFNEISKVANAYKDNEFVRNLTHKFYKLNPEKYLTNKYQLKGPQASKLLCSTLRAVQKQTNLPMISIIKAYLIKGMSYDLDSDVFKIDESKALNYLATYFDVIDRNKNKPERRYLEFQGIALGGFEYLHLKDWQNKYLVPKEPFIMDGKTYDAYTGETNMIRKATQEEIDELFG
ncbi:helicase domain protein [Acinetobacter bereziniae]|uniref:DEAD/DEAH box helicase n=1 Tax=Acinetobacter bereziniae TaxID=106648 RepID=UPI0005738B9E|nr:DEAD/DEAH box helicase [Acinetobacter bereziniae]CEI54232.1 helicase domain protein [Acinetobacter bereziniae]